MYESAQIMYCYLGNALRQHDRRLLEERDLLVYYQLGDAEGRAVIAARGQFRAGFPPGVQVCNALQRAEFTEHEERLTVSLTTDVATVTWDVTGSDLATLREHYPVGVTMNRLRIAGLTVELFKRLRASVTDVRNTEARGSASSRDDAYKLVTLFKGLKEGDIGDNELHILGLFLNNGPIGYKNFWNPDTLFDSPCELLYNIIITE